LASVLAARPPAGRAARGSAAALHQEFAGAGATIRLPPTNYWWALEFHVEDPDGHVIRLGSAPRSGEPFVEWVTWYRR
jgi:hypothetical protein